VAGPDGGGQAVEAVARMSFSVDINKRLGQKTLRLAFAAPAGLTAVFGESGVGKTSLIHMLSGLMRPDKGRIVIADEVVFDSERQINIDAAVRGAGLVFQDGRLFPHLNVRDNLIYGQKLAKRAAIISFDEAVAILGIEALLERRPQTLSGGEQQRVAIGRALLSAPRCLLLDEPLASLDGGRKGAILAVIETFRDRLNLPMLYVSHDLNEVKRLADHLVLIGVDGQVEASGALPALLNQADLSVASAEEAGSVLKVSLADYDHGYDLTRARLGTNDLWLPGHIRAAGDGHRLSIRASDVTISLDAPVASSALNSLKGRIVSLNPVRTHQISLEMAIDAADQTLIAHITRKSAETLGLKVGQTVYAQFKAQGLRGN
jgi:molybdate transport system ATP-binding protein